MCKKRVSVDATRSTPREQRLFKYVLTAGAGMLAASTPVDAGVIYVDVPDQTYTNAGFSLDLNSDGSMDVLFQNNAPGGKPEMQKLWALAAGTGGGVMASLYGDKVLALTQSAIVAPATSFVPNGKMAIAYRSASLYGSSWGGDWGEWANAGDRYLGLKFLIGPNTHYGWVRMNVTVDWPSVTVAATVKDWAYESTPDAAIHASVPSGEVPEPGTLSLLALGAVGLLAWRRRKTA